MHISPNQLTYMLHSWKEFQKARQSYELWLKRKSTASPLLARNASVGVFDFLNESFRAKGSEVPKLDIKFGLDKYEAAADLEIDHDGW